MHKYKFVIYRDPEKTTRKRNEIVVTKHRLRYNLREGEGELRSLIGERYCDHLKVSESAIFSPGEAHYEALARYLPTASDWVRTVISDLIERLRRDNVPNPEETFRQMAASF